MLRFSDAGSSFLFRLYQTMGGFSNTTPNFDRGGPSVNHPDGSYQLVNKKSGKLAEVPAGATADGIPLDQRAASGATSQLWQMM